MAFCKAIKENGEPCKAQAMANGYCYRHNPEISDEEKLQASATGGNKPTITRLERQIATAQDEINIRNLNGVVDLIENNIKDVRQGNIDPRVSNAIVQSLNVLLKVYELGIQDTRIRKLEEKAGIESPAELLSMGGN